MAASAIAGRCYKADIAVTEVATTCFIMVGGLGTVRILRCSVARC
jgi:hypothetical protein